MWAWCLVALVLLQCGACSSLAPSPIAKTIGDTVKELRASIQSALQARESRMVLSSLSDARFGVEKYKKGQEMKSGREMSKLVTEMFKGTPVFQNLVVVLPTEQQVEETRKVWGPSFTKTVALRSSEPLKRVSKGFGAAPEAATGIKSSVPPETEVLLVVEAEQVDTELVDRLSKSLGQKCVIMLINCFGGTSYWCSTSHKSVDRRIISEYIDVYTLQSFGSELVVHRKYPAGWSVYSNVESEPLATSSSRPSLTALQGALQSNTTKVPQIA